MCTHLVGTHLPTSLPCFLPVAAPDDGAGDTVYSQTLPLYENAVGTSYAYPLAGPSGGPPPYGRDVESSISFNPNTRHFPKGGYHGEPNFLDEGPQTKGGVKLDSQQVQVGDTVASIGYALGRVTTKRLLCTCMCTRDQTRPSVNYSRV